MSLQHQFTYSSLLTRLAQQPEDDDTANMIPLFFFLLLVLLLPHSSTARLGIPGATATISGYDTELGQDAICWKSMPARDSNNATGVEIPNPLVEGYVLDTTTGLELMQACPAGNSLQGESPVELRLYGEERLRTGQYYDYAVTGQLNLTSLLCESAAWCSTSPRVISDKGPVVAIQILMCALESSGFCSPFIHEEANERLVEQGLSTVVERGDRHGGSHVHSPYVELELPVQDGPLYDINVTVPTLVNDPGDFFVVAAVQLYLGTQGDGTVDIELRYDIANALRLNQRVIIYQPPAEILTVPDGVRYFAYVAIGGVAAVILFLLGQTIRHRKHQVMQLTQGNFLIVFLVAALVASVASFLLEPANDVYCLIQHPIIMISLHLVYAITFGRLWRINSVVSPLLVETLRQRHHVGVWTRLYTWMRRSSDFVLGRSSTTQSDSLVSDSMAMSSSLRNSSSSSHPRKLRKQVTAWQLTTVIVVITLPQVVLQVLALALQPRERIDDLNADESKGRAYCASNDGDLSIAAQIDMYGYYAFGALILSLLLMAHATRNLPSLFNETRVIFDSAVTTLTLLVVGVGIILATEDPTTSPAVKYMVSVAIVLSTTLNISVRIMMPKLRMVWRGETVVVSRLVSDHKAKVEADNEVYMGSLSSSSGSRKQPKSGRTATLSSSVISNSQGIMDEMNEFVNGDTTEGGDEEEDLTSVENGVAALNNGNANNDTTALETSPVADDTLPDRQGPVVRFQQEEDTPVRNNRRRKQSTLARRITVRPDHAPPRRLVLKMLSLQEELVKTNERLLSGLVVTEEDWNSVRRLNRKLNTTFEEDVTFEWEKQGLLGNSEEKTKDGEEEANDQEQQGSTEMEDRGPAVQETDGELPTQPCSPDLEKETTEVIPPKKMHFM